ncbi:MAG: hypothetical protein ABW223_00660, partial [Rariglobus sp.]
MPALTDLPPPETNVSPLAEGRKTAKSTTAPLQAALVTLKDVLSAFPGTDPTILPRLASARTDLAVALAQQGSLSHNHPLMDALLHSANAIAAHPAGFLPLEVTNHA